MKRRKRRQNPGRTALYGGVLTGAVGVAIAVVVAGARARELAVFVGAAVLALATGAARPGTFGRGVAWGAAGVAGLGLIPTGKP